MFNFIMIYNMK